MDEMIHRGCCFGSCNEDLNDNTEKSTSYFSSCSKLDDYNWLRDLPATTTETDLVEVRFKNTRKAFYRNVNQLRLKEAILLLWRLLPVTISGWLALPGILFTVSLLSMASPRVGRDQENIP